MPESSIIIALSILAIAICVVIATISDSVNL
jgi:hypothetical protein